MNAPALRRAARQTPPFILKELDETRLTLGVGTGFDFATNALPKIQSLTKNKFRFAEGKIVIDLPPKKPAEQMPVLRQLLEAL